MPRFINIKTLEKSVRQYHAMTIQQTDKIIWNFKDACTMDTAGLVILTALMDQMNKNGAQQTIRYNESNPRTQSVIDFMARMNLFEVCLFPYPNQKARYQKDTLCEISAVSLEDEVNVPIYKLRNMIKRHERLSALEVAATEIVMNAMHHAEASRPCYVAARIYRHTIEITICDTGIGIWNHLSKSFEGLKDDMEAIRLALEQYITGNRNGARSNSGMGLYISKSIFTQNDGTLIIWSGTGQYQLVRKQEKYTATKPYWQGTIVNMRYRLSNPVDMTQIYQRSSAEDDNSQLESIFS